MALANVTPAARLRLELFDRQLLRAGLPRLAALSGLGLVAVFFALVWDTSSAYLTIFAALVTAGLWLSRAFWVLRREIAPILVEDSLAATLAVDTPGSAVRATVRLDVSRLTAIDADASLVREEALLVAEARGLECHFWLRVDRPAKARRTEPAYGEWALAEGRAHVDRPASRLVLDIVEASRRQAFFATRGRAWVEAAGSTATGLTATLQSIKVAALSLEAVLDALALGEAGERPTHEVPMKPRLSHRIAKAIEHEPTVRADPWAALRDSVEKIPKLPKEATREPPSGLVAPSVLDGPGHGQPYARRRFFVLGGEVEWLAVEPAAAVACLCGVVIGLLAVARLKQPEAFYVFFLVAPLLFGLLHRGPRIGWVVWGYLREYWRWLRGGCRPNPQGTEPPPWEGVAITVWAWGGWIPLAIGLLSRNPALHGAHGFVVILCMFAAWISAGVFYARRGLWRSVWNLAARLTRWWSTSRSALPARSEPPPPLVRQFAMGQWRSALGLWVRAAAEAGDESPALVRCAEWVTRHEALPLEPSGYRGAAQTRALEGPDHTWLVETESNLQKDTQA